MRRQAIEHIIDEWLVCDRRWSGPEPREPSGALAVICKETVDISPDRVAVGGDRSLESPISKFGERTRAVRTGGDAHVHLVSGKRRAVVRFAANGLQALAWRERRLDVEQSETRDIAGRPLDPFGIGDGAPEHLVAAAQAEHAPTATHVSAMSTSNPASRSDLRSAIVAFEPGKMMRSASPGSALPIRTRTNSTAGSASSGSRSSKFAMCGRIGTAMRMRASGLGARA